jgi:CRISPR-associated protein (TIGR02584 family)
MNNISQLPHQYEKRILLVVIGMTPQIVTETLYKLAVDSDPQYIPTEIHLITTKEGANSAEMALLGTAHDQGWFYIFCEDYGISGITFNKENIHIIADTEGQFIDDSQSSAHNKIASDFITNKVKEFTQDNTTSLHVSLAGGRKTMSYYAGYALSLYGRWQDRLSHVLVNFPFMNNSNFFYPRPKAERFSIENRHYSTDDAHIILSDIPYVRMRYQVPEALLKGSAGFQETVEKIQLFNQAPTIQLYLKNNTVVLNGCEIQLTPRIFAFYVWFCQRQKEQKEALDLDQDDFVSDFLAVFKYFISEYSGRYEYIEKMLDHPQDPPKIKQQKGKQRNKWFKNTRGTKLHKALRDTLGKTYASHFYIEQNDEGHFQLDVDGNCIEFFREEYQG